jgi:hypothetical protein
LNCNDALPIFFCFIFFFFFVLLGGGGCHLLRTQSECIAFIATIRRAWQEEEAVAAASFHPKVVGWRYVFLFSRQKKKTIKKTQKGKSAACVRCRLRAFDEPKISANTNERRAVTFG